MQSTPQQAPYLGSPSLGAKSPPLSKYFQTPTPGRNSPNRLPNLQVGDIGPNASSESLPTLSQRPPISPSSIRWAHDSPQNLDTGQQRLQPRTPLSAPFGGQSQFASYNPQDSRPMRGGPGSPLGPSRFPTGQLESHPDTSKWGVKLNHRYSRSQDVRPLPLLPPRPVSRARDDVQNPQNASKSPTRDDGGGYQLRPVAYDPNPPLKESDDPRQSWQQGDDINSMQPSPPALSPPKPPKNPTSQPPQDPQDVRIAPQLPPLYFESPPKVQQQDFAYSKQPIQTGSTSSESFMQPQFQKPPAQNLSQTRSYVGSPQSTQMTRPSPPIQIRQAAQQAFLPSQPPSKSIRKSPPQPVIAPSLQSETRRKPNKGLNGTRPEQQSQVIRIPDTKTSIEDNLEDSNNSFYFHSPQSSIDSSHEQSPKAAAADTNGMLSSKTVTSDYGLSSASALGFGGPSDWERFGDYDAEEVDDLDLYVSSKPKTAELPATTSPADEVHKPAQIVQGEPRPEAGIEEPAVEHNLSEQASEDSNSDKSNKTVMKEYEEPLEAIGVKEARSSPEQGPSHLPLFLPGSTFQANDETSGREPPIVDNHESPLLAPPEEALIASEQTRHGDDDRIPPEDDIDEELLNKKALEFAAGFEDAGVRTMELTNSDDEDGGRFGLERFDTQTTNVEHQETAREKRDDGSRGRSFDDNRAKQTDSVGIEDDQYSIRNGKDEDGVEDIIISLHIPETPDELVPGQEEHECGSHERNTKDTEFKSIQLGLLAPESSEDARNKRHSYFPKSIEMEDPYANLDAWAKASLNRYVKMLHEERQEDTDEQKYLIFTNFTRRETRLRAILYDMDDEQELVDQAVKRTPLKESTSILTLRPSIKSKALPALPPGVQRSPPLRTKKSNKELEAMSVSQDGNDASMHLSYDADSRSNTPQSGSGKQGKIAQGMADQSFVMVDSPNTEQYTPGGRPSLAQIDGHDSSSPLRVTPSLTSFRNPLGVVGSPTTDATRKDSRSPGLNNPMGAAPTITELKISETPRSNSVPLPSASDPAKDTLSLASEKPAYTPFMYNEGRPYEGDKATNRQSIYQPFSTILRQGSQRQTSMYGEPPTPSASTFKQLMRPDASEAGSERSTSVTPTTVPPVNAPRQRFSILEPLLVVVPPTSVLRPEPRQVTQIRQQIESIPDDFGFIRDTVIAWDREMKQTQDIYDRERHTRQGENEQRINALFNENEIGYGDISELETEFKRSEAARKAKEDRFEYESFVSKVFEVVWARLHYEMDLLTPLYDVCVQMLNDATAGKDMFDETSDRVPVAPAMDSLLVLYQKLGVRHQKAFEAVLERDRRLKKNELAPWYASGNIGKVKKIEKRFEDAEKKAILEFCGQRDERANLLMDVLDQNTLRGVGSNQDYMESVMQAVRKIALDVALGGMEEDTVISTDEVLKAKTITSALARSSEQIVQTFHVADMLLNSADYEASLASARLANADTAAFQRLREAKAMEDLKLVKDLEHRMSLIRGDTSRTQDEITKLLSLIGSSPSTPPRSTSAPADPDRESRLLAALEEAKRRNAQKGVF
ncbi:hypothetical protein MMC13_000513 [Lambiella insularis]|nr:hypothetical protein [Lambiella insularis]